MLTEREILTVKEALQINPVTLAFVGDTVYSLYVRERLALSGCGKVGQLQKVAAQVVSAKGQSEFLDKVLPIFTEEETDVFRRGVDDDVRLLGTFGGNGQPYANTLAGALCFLVDRQRHAHAITEGAAALLAHDAVVFTQQRVLGIDERRSRMLVLLQKLLAAVAGVGNGGILKMQLPAPQNGVQMTRVEQTVYGCVVTGGIIRL